jgi:hypothetical protein
VPKIRNQFSPKNGMTPGQPTRKMGQHQARTLITKNADEPGRLFGIFGESHLAVRYLIILMLRSPSSERPSQS